MRAVEVVRALGGTARTAQILELTSLSALRTAHSRGALVRVRHGVYCVPDATMGPFARVAMRGVISHQSAASHWKIEQLNPASEVHVTVPRNSRPEPRVGIRLHYADVPDEIVTSPVRTVLDCARLLPFADALAIADSACNRKLVTAAELVRAAGALRGAGRGRIQRVVARADGRAANPFESALRAIVIEAGVTGFEPQFEIPGIHPTIRVDLADPTRRIVLEADSFAHHGSRPALERDCRRYSQLVRHGWRPLRFAWEHVMFDQRWVRAMVLGTCADQAPTVPARRSRPRAARRTG